MAATRRGLVLLALSLLLEGAWARVGQQAAHGLRSRASPPPARAGTPLLVSAEADLRGEYDVAVVGAGIGGLCAAAVLTQVYGKRVAVCEAHYLPGGCAHAFDRCDSSGRSYTFDSGPTIVLGCSAPPYNPLRQVLNAVGAGDAVEWIRYDGWGMLVPPAEAPDQPTPGAWKLQLGTGNFQQGPLSAFGGAGAVEEFEALREACSPLVSAAADIPAMAMRGDAWSIFPLLRHFEALRTLVGQVLCSMMQ